MAKMNKSNGQVRECMWLLFLSYVCLVVLQKVDTKDKKVSLNSLNYLYIVI